MPGTAIGAAGQGAGAIVIASTSYPESRPFLKELGADKVIVTEEQDLVLEVERFTAGKGVEVVLDQCAGPQMKLLGDVASPRGKLILYGINGGNDAAFPACAAFKKHLQFFRHCVMDFTGDPETGLERDEAAVQRALAHINQMTGDRLLAEHRPGLRVRRLRRGEPLHGNLPGRWPRGDPRRRLNRDCCTRSGALCAGFRLGGIGPGRRGASLRRRWPLR